METAQVHYPHYPHLYDIDGNDCRTKHVFSLGAGDRTNDLYEMLDNNGDMIVVHDGCLQDADRRSWVANKAL